MNADEFWEHARNTIAGWPLNGISGRTLAQITAACKAAGHSSFALTLGGWRTERDNAKEPFVVEMRAVESDSNQVLLDRKVQTLFVGVDAWTGEALIQLMQRRTAAMRVIRPYYRPPEPKTKRPRTGWGRGSYTRIF